MTGTLPVAGTLSSSTIQSTFGLTGSLASNQLYRGGSIIPNGPTQNANVPTSGAISLGDLYGATDVASPTGYTFTATISANTQNYDLASAATAAGWNGTEALFASVTINAGVVVGSTSSAAAFVVPSLPANSTVALANNGYIVGMGGNGGHGANYNGSSSGGSSGTSGGLALSVAYPTTLTGTGIIGGGGGGGGGGAGGQQAVKIGSNPTEYAYYGGGGGGAGAGYNGGTIGAGGTASGGSYSNTNGANGGSASATGGGAGGNSGNNTYASPGGSGGSLGASGATGSYGGGASGAAVSGNANISYQWSGTIYGPVS